MIEFLTLFLGLATGPKEVAVVVGKEVAAVEFVLDGELAATVAGDPWRTTIDFGSELVPQELAAVARDEKGGEVGRVVQRVNVPRPPAEITILLEREEGGAVKAARLGWESTLQGRLEAVRARMDGVELALPDGPLTQRIELPRVAADDFHLLEIELEFAGAVFVREQVGFGGHLDRAGSQLTAVPVELAGAQLEPEAKALAQWFRREGRPLDVVAIESGTAQVIVVRTAGAAAALNRLAGAPGIEAQGRSPGMRLARIRNAFEAAKLAEDQLFRLLYPVAQREIGHEMVHEVFPMTPPIAPDEGGIYWHAAPELELEEDGEPRLADAVAVAGNQAAAGGSRRAVLLLLGPRAADSESRYSPLAVRRYLEALRVPLHVWYLGREKHAPETWGKPVVVSSFKRFKEEVAELQNRLDRQRVVWVDGSHLLRSVELAPAATGLRLLD